MSIQMQTCKQTTLNYDLPLPLLAWKQGRITTAAPGPGCQR